MKIACAFCVGCSQIRGELQTIVTVLRKKFGQEILVDRHAPIAQHGNLLLVIVHADNRVPDLRKTYSRHQTHIA